MSNDVTTATSPLEHTGATTPTPEPTEAGLQDAAFRLPVKFNKQDYHLSLEEATAYAQKGMKFDTVEPMLDQLKDLAQRHGLGVREMVEALCEDTALSAPVPAVSVEERLAAEYRQLQETCPDAPAFEALPETVLRTAVDEGLALTDAYLRYDYGERRRIAAAETAAKTAGARSAGTQHTALESAPDPTIEAMVAGVRG